MDMLECRIAQELVQSKPPVPFYGGAELDPTRVHAAYWPTEDGNGWQLSAVAIYGRRLDNGKPGSMQVKAVFWLDTLPDAPQWVQTWVADHTPVSTS